MLGKIHIVWKAAGVVASKNFPDMGLTATFFMLDQPATIDNVRRVRKSGNQGARLWRKSGEAHNPSC